MRFMAKKMNASRLAQETRRQTEAANRRPAPQMAAFYLMPPRPLAGNVFPPRRRLQISIDGMAHAQIPQSVKITHAG
jgi:hypothetical protein